MSDAPTNATLQDVDERLGQVETRLGTLERRVNSIDNRLERVEGKQEAMLAWQQVHSERVDALSARMDSRFDCLEKLIRDGLNGSEPHG